MVFIVLEIINKGTDMTIIEAFNRKRKAFVFTMVNRLSRVAERHLHLGLLVRGQGFTMAEILISLTIIGIIAAITLPALRANINEKAWATQRKALYNRMSQAIAMMPSLNGYGVDPENETNTTNNAAQTFVTNGLSNVLKIKNICSNNELSKCGIVSKYKNMGGVKKTFPTTLQTLNFRLVGSYSGQHAISTAHYSYSLQNTNAAAFETANGESVAVFYQPYCIDNLSNLSAKTFQYIAVAPLMCANFVFDLNGKKGPNQIGKDMGIITALYPTDSNVVMPVPLHKDSKDEDGNESTTYAKAVRACRLEGSDVRLPNNEEWASMVINLEFFDLKRHLEVSGNPSALYATGTRTANWAMSAYYALLTNAFYGDNVRIRCIKR